MKLVVFAGAGFSAAFGLPVMNSFLGFADASDRLSVDDKALLGRLILEARRANSFLESSATNLEDILSFSEMGDRLGLAPADEKSRSERVRGIVERVFTSAPISAEYWSQFDNVRRIIDYPAHETPQDVTFITTNYDLNIEIACHRAGWRATLGTPLQRFRDEWHSVGQLYHDTGVPIYKLHGSVNWFPSDDKKDGLLVNDVVVRLQSGETFPHVCTSGYVPPWSPLIVPPSFLKPELAVPLRTAWAGAARALAEANTVAFIGYSFPQSDTEMMYFLARALSDNSSLRRILIIDPQAEAIGQRLRRAESKSGTHFRDLMRLVSHRWQDLPDPLHSVAT